MTIEYETTAADVEAWNQDSLARPEMKRIFRKRALSLAVFTGLVVGALSYGATTDITPSAITAGVLFIVIAAFGASALRHETLKALRKALDAEPTSPALGHHTLQVTPESVTEACPHHTLSVRWHAVSDALRTDEHLFILLRSLGAIIVPLRSFASQTDRDTFIQHVLQFTPTHAPSLNTRNA